MWVYARQGRWWRFADLLLAFGWDPEGQPINNQPQAKEKIEVATSRINKKHELVKQVLHVLEKRKQKPTSRTIRLEAQGPVF